MRWWHAAVFFLQLFLTTSVAMATDEPSEKLPDANGWRLEQVIERSSLIGAGEVKFARRTPAIMVYSFNIQNVLRGEDSLKNREITLVGDAPHDGETMPALLNGRKYLLFLDDELDGKTPAVAKERFKKELEAEKLKMGTNCFTPVLGWRGVICLDPGESGERTNQILKSKYGLSKPDDILANIQGMIGILELSDKKKRLESLEQSRGRLNSALSEDLGHWLQNQ